MSKRPFPLHTGTATVRSVEELTPSMVRIVFEGADLAHLPDEQPGEIITFIWPAEGRGDVVLPDDGWSFPDDCPQQEARNYTVRWFDPSGPTMAVDFVRHGDHAFCSRWAGAARPGDVLGWAGPRIHFEPREDATWTLLAGDETALPSIAATLEQLPSGHPAHVFLEAADADHEVEITSAADVHLTWVHRDGEPAGLCRKLEAALREADLPDDPAATIWVAGESLMVRGLREHIRGERGLKIMPMQAIGYWRHRETPEAVDLEEAEEAAAG